MDLEIFLNGFEININGPVECLNFFIFYFLTCDGFQVGWDIDLSHLSGLILVFFEELLAETFSIKMFF